jgi:hypothetical protein
MQPSQDVSRDVPEIDDVRFLYAANPSHQLIQSVLIGCNIALVRKAK